MAVIAPSSPFEPRLAWRGLGALATDFRVRYQRSMFTGRGLFAGDDQRRLDELDGALRDPSVRMILAARGGYGAQRIAHLAAWDALRAEPKWLVGFSDVTALHLEATRVGVASLHACNLTMLGRGDARARQQLLQVLGAPPRARRVEGLLGLAEGRARGPLVGGNLTVLHGCAAAGRLALPEGAILLLEDVTELPYRIDRMLTTLQVGGHLAGVAAIVLGDFTHCGPGPDGVDVRAVLAERLAVLGVPVAAGLPVGHGRQNDPVALGLTAELHVEGDRAALVLAVDA